MPFLTLLLLQLLVAGRVSLQAGGSGAASTLPAAAGLELDLQHAPEAIHLLGKECVGERIGNGH